MNDPRRVSGPEERHIAGREDQQLRSGSKSSCVVGNTARTHEHGMFVQVRGLAARLHHQTFSAQSWVVAGLGSTWWHCDYDRAARMQTEWDSDRRAAETEGLSGPRIRPTVMRDASAARGGI